MVCASLSEVLHAAVRVAAATTAKRVIRNSGVSLEITRSHYHEKNALVYFDSRLTKNFVT